MIRWRIRRIVNGCSALQLVARRDLIAPEFISEPTLCSGCGKVIDLGNDGYSQLGDRYRCEKFKLKTVRYLLAYRKVGSDLELVMIGPHENYYRDLKQYLKDR